MDRLQRRPSEPAPFVFWWLTDYNAPEELAGRTVPSVTQGVEVMTAAIEREIWTLVRPGDTVTFGGTSVVITDDAIPRTTGHGDRDDDLPAR